MTLFCYKQKEMKTEVHVDALLHISVGGLSIVFHIIHVLNFFSKV